MYWQVSDYGWGYLAVSALGGFILIETCAYYSHVALHRGWLYKRFHSKHHRYKSPHWYTLASMDTLEQLFHGSYLFLPAFLFPIHGAVFFGLLVYCFVAGFWDHVGARLPFNLPFHGNAQFHDDHHKYVHVNFGFLCNVYDRIYDTLRREGHHYTEETFAGGKGVVRDPDAIRDRACGPQFRYPHHE